MSCIILPDRHFAHCAGPQSPLFKHLSFVPLTLRQSLLFLFFFFNDPAPPEISTLPLPAALPIPVRFRRLPGRLPLRVRQERRPHPLAVGEVVVGADIDELVRFTDDGLPEADDPDPVLLEEVQRDLGEAPLEVGHTSGHHVVRAVLVDHRVPPGWLDSIVVADVIPSRREVRYAARRLRWRGNSLRSSRTGRRFAISRAGLAPRPTTSSSPGSR